MTPQVAIGVPVWRAAAFVAETLQSVLGQRDVSLSVQISVDGGDPGSMEACRPFLSDPRVSLEAQESRLGWVANSARVLQMAAATGAPYVAIQPHDDLIEPTYLATLLATAEAEKAVVTYSDIASFGAHAHVFRQDSTRGSPFERQMTMLTARYDAVAYRGLTRADALSAVPPISGNAFDDFAADAVWMARLARVGELVRVPQSLYRKRYHQGNTHAAWSSWPVERHLGAWATHCRAMLDEALAVAATPGERDAFHGAARARLLQQGQPIGPYQEAIREMSAQEKAELLARFEG
jgi:GT2 family glycosyltransferase